KSKLHAGLGGCNENRATVFAPALAPDEAFVFEAIENAYDCTGADMHFATDGRGRHGALVDNCPEADQLRRRDIAASRKLPRMQRNGTGDTTQIAQNAQVVRLSLSRRVHG